MKFTTRNQRRAFFKETSWSCGLVLQPRLGKEVHGRGCDRWQVVNCHCRVGDLVPAFRGIRVTCSGSGGDSRLVPLCFEDG